MKQTSSGSVVHFSVPEWDDHRGIVHAFFTRVGGVSPAPYASLNMGQKAGDESAHVRQNLAKAARALSIPPESIFCASQIHGDWIHPVSGDEASIFGTEDPLQGDGLITAERGLTIGVLTADCVPILLLDPDRPVVGAVHAGWRGTAQGIAGKAVARMCASFGCTASRLRAAIGPAVGPCCYVVGEDVARPFRRMGPGAERFLHPEGSGRWKLNLAALNRHQLMGGGVSAHHITSSSMCTSCRKDLFFSVRAEGDPTGRQISLIGILPSQVTEGGHQPGRG